MATGTVPGAADQEVVTSVDDGAADDTTGGEATLDTAAEAEGGDEAASQAGGRVDDDGEPLLTDEEIEAAGGDVEKLKKQFQRAYTQKTQRLAAANKLWKALENDPVAVARELNTRLGIKLADVAPPADATPRQQAKALDVITARLTKSVGAEMAAELAPAILEAAELVANEKVTGVQQVVGTQLMQDIKERADIATESFFKAHPDAKALEPKMMEIAKEIQPAPGITVTQYFERLYSLAKGSGAKARDAVDRMVKATESDPRPGSTPARVVSGARPDRSKMTKAEFLRASFEAADKGIRWEPKE